MKIMSEITKKLRVTFLTPILTEFEQLGDTPSLSFLLNDLLKGWVVDQQLKKEFERLNNQ
jgi:hypothetical protein